MAPPGKRPAPKSRKKAEYQVPAVVRALDIMEYLARHREASFTQIHTDLALPKSSAYQILGTLARRGYVRHQGDSPKYSLGLRLFEMGTQAVARLDIRTEARPILRELVAKTGETCHLGALDGRESVYLAKVEGHQTFRLHSWEGKRLPLHSTAMGKVFLAWMEPEELAELLDGLELKPYTERTITERDRLEEHVRTVRERGWALDDQENEDHIRCLSAPVRGLDGRVRSAISISGLATKFDGEYLLELADLVREACDKLSAILSGKE